MDTVRAALFFEPGKPMTLTEFPVVEPGPGSVSVRVTRANVCGSDLHFWRGDGRLEWWNRQDGAIIGHEMTGVVHALGDGVVTDWAGAPLAVGDRVVYQYFAPCGRCRACLRGMTPACPAALGRMFTDPHQPPHFNGAFADYYHVSPRMALFKVPGAVSDTMVAGANCALAQVIYGLERVGVGFNDTVVIQGAGGLGAYATAVAKERGAHQVIVIDGLDDRLALARAMGADATVDFREHRRPETGWLRCARSPTDGAPTSSANRGLQRGHPRRASAWCWPSAAGTWRSAPSTRAAPWISTPGASSPPTTGSKR